MTEKRTRWWHWVLIALVSLILLAAAAWIGNRYYLIRMASKPAAESHPGEWIELRPEGIVSANGEPVYTEMRVGRENKVVIFFYGGGVSVNPYTAEHPFTDALFLSDENGFYSDDIDGMIPDNLELGLGSSGWSNPFRDWTIVVIPYATGDFHIGTADYEYSTPDGGPYVLYHHGYTNYRAIMDEARPYLPEDPEQLLIAGYSAGGFGASFLAGDLVENYFPDAGHVTVCVDSALLAWENWKETARDVWGAPEEILESFRTVNPIVDCFVSLYGQYGDRMTFLYVGSTRDGELARYHNYFENGNYTVTSADGMDFTVELREMILQLKKNVPTFSVYLFNNLPFSMRPNQLSLTQHTVIITWMFTQRLTDRTRVADWIMDATKGYAWDHGINLMQ